MKSFIGEGAGVEPLDNRQLPSSLWEPGSRAGMQKKTLGFTLIPNCKLKFGPVHDAPGTSRAKGSLPPPPPSDLNFLTRPC